MKSLFNKQITRKLILGSQKDLTINYIGYFTASTGLSIGARKYLDVLLNQEYKINCVDLIPYVKQKSIEKCNFHLSSMKKAAINILHVNAHELPNIIRILGKDYFNESYNIGIWAWELPNFPTEWQDRFELLNEIWALSSFTAKAISIKTHLPVIPIPYCISKIKNISSRSTFNIPKDEFIFLFSFDGSSISYRKNPEAVIAAFKLAFSFHTSVRLIIKINHATSDDIHSLNQLAKHLRVTIISQTLSTEAQHALIASCDCYISLHRAEGLGLGMAEAMSLGKPVIATGWSGNTDFMNICNAFLVKYHLITLKKSISVYPSGSIMAEPNIKHAAKLMRMVYHFPALRVKIGLRAKHDIEKTMSEKAIGNILNQRLQFIIHQLILKKQKMDIKLFLTKIKMVSHGKVFKKAFSSIFNLIVIYPYFNKHFYCSHHKIHFKFKFIAILHYQSIGWKRNWQAHPLFDNSWYLKRNQDVKRANIEPLQHYIMYGWHEGRQPHPSYHCDLKSFKALSKSKC